jgi:hypothetical protein
LEEGLNLVLGGAFVQQLDGEVHRLHKQDNLATIFMKTVFYVILIVVVSKESEFEENTV